MQSLSILSYRATVGFSLCLLPVPRACLQEGETQAVGLGRQIKHLDSRSHTVGSSARCSGGRSQTKSKSRLKASLGYTAVGLCVRCLERSQAEKAQEQGDHGTALCQLQGNHSSLTEIKLSVCFRRITFSEQDFHLCTTSALHEGSSDLNSTYFIEVERSLVSFFKGVFIVSVCAPQATCS